MSTLHLGHKATVGNIIAESTSVSVDSPLVLLNTIKFNNPQPTSGQVLTFTGGVWQPQTPTTGNPTIGSASGTSFFPVMVTGTGTQPLDISTAELAFNPTVGALTIGANSVSVGIISSPAVVQSSATNGVAIGSSATINGTSSIAIGHGTSATGSPSTAIGSSIGASGNHSVAIGDGTTNANNNYAVSIGHNISSGKTSVGIGRDNNAAYNYAVAIGGFAHAATRAISIGYDTNAVTSAVALQASTNGIKGVGLGFALVNGYESIGIGNNIYTTGLSSIAIGGTAVHRGTKCYGNYAITIGSNAAVLSSGTMAIAMGKKATATAANVIAIGTISSGSGISGVAIGRSASSSQNSSVAIGNVASASSSSAISIGHNSSASNLSAIGIGTASNASGFLSVAIGNSASASQNLAVAIGNDSNCTQPYSVALGFSASSTATNSVSIGRSASASYSSAIAIGYSASATTAPNNIAIGHSASATSSAGGAIAIGHGANATGSAGNGGIAIGSGSPNTRATSQNAIAIGGTAYATNHSSIAIGYNAYSTGIYSIAIGGGTGATGTKKKVQATGYYTVCIGSNLNNSSANSFNIRCRYGGSINRGVSAYLNSTFTQSSNHGVTVGGFELVMGSSTARLKKNIRTLEDVGHKIDQMKPRRYKPNSDDTIGFSSREHIGFVAEELNEVFPEFVVYGGDGVTPDAISYPEITSVLTREIQSLRRRLYESEMMISELKNFVYEQGNIITSILSSQAGTK